MEWVVKYWIEAAFALIVASMGVFYKRVCGKLAEQTAIKAGMQALLRDRIIQTYNYHTEKGYCAIYEKDNIMNMYQQYHKLGANGVIDDMVQEVINLPTCRRKGVV